MLLHSIYLRDLLRIRQEELERRRTMPYPYLPRRRVRGTHKRSLN
jgi:hypothetical protein